MKAGDQTQPAVVVVISYLARGRENTREYGGGREYIEYIGGSTFVSAAQVYSGLV